MERSPKYFAFGLRLGLIESQLVQEWVNEQITLSEVLSDELLDLSYIDNTRKKEMYSVLNAMPDENDDYEALRNLFSEVMKERLEDINYCAQLARELYLIFCAHKYECPDDFNFISHFDDAFSLAFQGILGDPEMVQMKFINHILSFKKTANQRV
ncbi:MAG: hypothetical protein AB2765_16215 [Candidatus Thiodiazotropha endolucinida]